MRPREIDGGRRNHMNKHIAQEIVVGGLSGLGLVAGYILLRGYLDSASAGDWLQFAGAMMGTGLAVAGALYVEKRRRDHDKDRGKATLLDALRLIDTELDDFLEPLTGDLSKDVAGINARRFFLEAAKGYAEFVLKQHLIPDSKVWRSTTALMHYIDRVLSVTWYEHDPANGEDNCTKATVEHWHERVTKIVNGAKPAVEKVIAREEGREVVE